ncbi:hypothetical protein [Virgibacillus halodenitrificans]|uniref:hypothetical protein n=1 Tax=Virgibacillus halodenitrificans TaxID=1482 RepID=UPI002DBEC71A|nr:hypothetical protein [Virgibacillus halodenitrificans]MEC2158879.1 hypothetical protein [Virgibacillus halodenitrificans]
MADKKKQPHLVITVGYLGFIFFLLAGLRYILIIEDQVGRLLMACSSVLLWYSFNIQHPICLQIAKKENFSSIFLLLEY